jgi:hypothetical protein
MSGMFHSTLSWTPPTVVTEAMQKHGHTFFTDGRNAVLHFSNEGGIFLHYTDTDEVFYVPMERVKR